jgi:hypothetical protein
MNAAALIFAPIVTGVKPDEPAAAYGVDAHAELHGHELFKCLRSCLPDPPGGDLR